MDSHERLEIEQIRAAIADLGALSESEYGMRLEQLLLDETSGPLRLQRLSGIVLKRKFARRRANAGYSMTGANWSWPWVEGSPEPHGASSSRELQLLNELRKAGPWNESKPQAQSRGDESSWEDFKADVEHERGLFKILALWVDDKWNGNETKTLRAYLETPESRRFETGLDLTTLVFDAAITGPLAALLGVPTLAVGVALVGIQYGYRRLTDPTEDRVGDDQS
jgi:hypothetical protein